ncbi:MAG TPA: glycogen debranching N-terminal domain-containing protein [Thermoanaerobaculia bacterium]|nr:glycogen debranching N-terminal domain-containing protein [Thermoanaerobaculia bacterium]
MSHSSGGNLRAGDVRIRPDTVYAWSGPAVLITNCRGECANDLTLTGFYFRETRYLATLRLEINGEPPWLCEIATPEPDRIEVLLLYPEMESFGGGGSGQSGDELLRNENGIPYRALNLQLSYRVSPSSLDVELIATNHSPELVRCEVVWTLDTDFADLQEANAGQRQLETPVRAEPGSAALRLVCQHPRLPLETRIAAAGPTSWKVEVNRMTTTIDLAPRQSERLGLRIEAVDRERPLDPEEASRRQERSRAWAESLARVEIPGNRVAERVIACNARDLTSLALLEGLEDEWLALQAGMPLYPGLFGRDALTAGWQATSLDCGTCLAATLNRLGRMQSDRFDDRHDEEPGRIPFQVRQGPLSRLGIDPFAAYYADFASPLMFVIALAHLFAWTGEKETVRRHWDTARRILDWAREHGDRDGDGYLEYLTKSPKGPKNQGWKDSGDGLVDERGGTVLVPIATCELQGYWFAAQQLMGIMAWFLGQRADAKAWWQSARELKERFNRDWWMEDEKFIAMALDRDKRLVRSIGSNAGHCLTSGILSDEHIPRVAGRLFAPDMYSGWGIRTLSTEHPSYNPVSYHLGSVWLVENATIALGLRRYGFDAPAVELARSFFDLACLYPDYRVPECVGGYGRWERSSPGAYPRANAPQTWNASAFPLLLHTLLGLQPVAPLKLLVVDPALPSWLPEVVLRGLRLGRASFTLRCWRDEQGSSHAEIVEKKGKVRLLRQPPPESLSAGVTDRIKALVESLRHH